MPGFARRDAVQKRNRPSIKSTCDDVFPIVPIKVGEGEQMLSDVCKFGILNWFRQCNLRSNTRPFGFVPTRRKTDGGCDWRGIVSVTLAQPPGRGNPQKCS
jgi:hypothetical protein